MRKSFNKKNNSASNNSPESSNKNINYVTPLGLAELQKEYQHLLFEERPKIVAVVSWAAKNGDRSENGDYIYGKKRLREIDSRVRYLTKRLDSAKVVDPALQKSLSKVFFGATVTYQENNETNITVKIVGIDEADATNGKISWTSPVAKALMKSEVGSKVKLHVPSGDIVLEVMKIEY